MATNKLTGTELNKAKALYVRARLSYNAGKYIMSDEAYDELEARIRASEPGWVELEKTGMEGQVVGKKQSVTLPIAMPSLNKLWADHAAKVEAWVEKALAKSPTQELVGTPKLDGSSVQAVYAGHKLKDVATRGDGITGKSFMHLAPYLPGLPKSFPDTKPYTGMTLRMEAIISNKDFAKHLAEEFDTSRAAVAGLLNRTKPHPAMKYIKFVVLRLQALAPFAPSAYLPLLYNQRQGLLAVERLGFETVPTRVFTDHAALVEDFSKQIAKWRAELPYDQDGLALTTCGVYEKPTQDKPKWSVAFKNNSQSEVHQTTIEELIWQPSKSGKLVPKLRIKPVKFNGTTVTFCAASNAKRCQDRGWGPGAVVKIRRSGDIIPEVVETVKPGKFTMPPKETGAYTWSGVHLQLLSNLSTEVRGKQLHAAASALGMEFLAVKSFVKYAEYSGMNQAVFVRSLYKNPNRLMSSMEEAGLSPVVLKKFLATKPAAPMLTQLIVASNWLGESYGTRMVEKMLGMKYLDWYGEPRDVLTQLRVPAVEQAFVDVLGPKRGKEMLVGIKDFYGWYLRFPAEHRAKPTKVVVKVSAKSQRLAGVKASWTGYRDKEQEEQVVANGGEVVPYGSKTTVLFFKANGKASTKVDKAKSAGKEVSANFAQWFKTHA